MLTSAGRSPDITQMDPVQLIGILRVAAILSIPDGSPAFEALNVLKQKFTSLEAELAEKNQRIAELETIIVQRTQELIDKNKTIAEQARRIANLNILFI